MGPAVEELDYAVQNGLVIATDNRSGAVVIPLANVVNWHVLPETDRPGRFALAAITTDGAHHRIASGVASMSIAVAKLVELAGRAAIGGDERSPVLALATWWAEHKRQFHAMENADGSPWVHQNDLGEPAHHHDRDGKVITAPTEPERDPLDWALARGPSSTRRGRPLDDRAKLAWWVNHARTHHGVTVHTRSEIGNGVATSAHDHAVGGEPATIHRHLQDGSIVPATIDLPPGFPADTLTSA